MGSLGRRRRAALCSGHRVRNPVTLTSTYEAGITLVLFCRCGNRSLELSKGHTGTGHRGRVRTQVRLQSSCFSSHPCASSWEARFPSVCAHVCVCVCACTCVCAWVRVRACVCARACDRVQLVVNNEKHKQHESSGTCRMKPRPKTGPAAGTLGPACHLLLAGMRDAQPPPPS